VIPSTVPTFVKCIIESGLSADWSARPSFASIYEALKIHDFDIVEGNDVNEVLRFVSDLEASQYSGVK
jgi:hypothetical protein